jgi:hypothetical protein
MTTARGIAVHGLQSALAGERREEMATGIDDSKGFGFIQEDGEKGRARGTIRGCY